MLEAMKESSASSTVQSSGFDCPDCKDTGFILEKDEEGRLIGKECKCYQIRRAKQLLQNSGLAEFVGHQTFDSFIAETPVQKNIKTTAERYLHDLLALKGKKEERKPWLFVGGNPGSGKTHICTAVCGELLKDGVPVKYMQWITEAKRLKSYLDPDEFDEQVESYISTPVLYIDDLLKQKYTENPVFTEADIKIAFTVLNARYFANKPTIISSEWDLINHLLEADEGVFSRVYERCKGYTVLIGRNRENDFRLKGSA